jgi:uncharacterized membrane protein YgcG
MRTEEIAQLAQILDDDRWSSYPKYPEQAWHAIRDDRVIQALSEIREGAVLTNVVSFGYSFFTGLVAICFRFSGSGMLGGPSDVLALLDSRCHVIGVLDKFNFDQPNDLLPPLPERGEQPFVLANPSGGAADVPTEEAWARELRSSDYLKRLTGNATAQRLPIERTDGGDDGGGGDGGNGDNGDGDNGGGGSGTMCSYATSTNTLVGITCKQLTGLIAPHCDAWGNNYVPDEHTDAVVDDSG